MEINFMCCASNPLCGAHDPLYGMQKTNDLFN